MPTDVTLPWGGIGLTCQLKMWTHTDGAWQGTHWRSVIDWSEIPFVADPGHGNPNVPNTVYVRPPTVVTAGLYDWQKRKIPAWERWQWVPGTKPHFWFNIQSEGCTGMYEALSRHDGSSVVHRPDLGHGWWEARYYGAYAAWITLDCFLTNFHP